MLVAVHAFANTGGQGGSIMSVLPNPKVVLDSSLLNASGGRAVPRYNTARMQYFREFLAQVAFPHLAFWQRKGDAVSPH